MNGPWRLAPAIALLAACSCGHAGARRPAPKPIPALSASLSFPSNVRALVDVPFTLTLADQKTGKPLPGAKAVLNLSMPAMSMPPDTAALAEERPEVYVGQGIFTMSGDWDATAIVTDSKGRVARRVFPVRVE